MKLDEIARRISAHLRRFEADPKINPLDPVSRTRRYYMANAFSTGRRVAVLTVSYQYAHKLTKAQAESYLAWLNAGNVGNLYDWQAARPGGSD